MTDIADLLVALAMAIEQRGTINANETFILNIAQREWIATSLRHEAERKRQQLAWDDLARYETALKRIKRLSLQYDPIGKIAHDALEPKRGTPDGPQEGTTKTAV